jgi:hypothetical protein
MAKIEWCSLTYKVGTEMMESEWEKTFMTIIMIPQVLGSHS